MKTWPAVGSLSACQESGGENGFFVGGAKALEVGFFEGVFVGVGAEALDDDFVAQFGFCIQPTS